MFNLPRDVAHDTLPPPAEPPTFPDLGTLAEVAEPSLLPEAMAEMQETTYARNLAVVRFAEELNGLLYDLRAKRASEASQP